LGGRTELVNYKTSLDSFVCTLMPNSGNVQIHTTPGMDQSDLISWKFDSDSEQRVIETAIV
jgi:hypothetical protein